MRLRVAVGAVHARAQGLHSALRKRNVRMLSDRVSIPFVSVATAAPLVWVNRVRTNPAKKGPRAFTATGTGCAFRTVKPAPIAPGATIACPFARGVGCAHLIEAMRARMIWIARVGKSARVRNAPFLILRNLSPSAVAVRKTSIVKAVRVACSMAWAVVGAGVTHGWATTNAPMVRVV